MPVMLLHQLITIICTLTFRLKCAKEGRQALPSERSKVVVADCLEQLFQSWDGHKGSAWYDYASFLS